MPINVDLMGRNAVQGEIANYIAEQGQLDPAFKRPFIDKKGRFCVTVLKRGADPTKLASYQTILVNAATLRRDEWKQLDDAIMMVSRERLGGAQDLIDKGLTYNLGNAMGTTVLEWHDVSDSMEADLTMDGITRSKGDRPVFQYNYLPIPIIHVDYEINARALEASRKLGNPLDTTGAEAATRRVLEKLEDMFFTNTTYSFGEKDSRTRNTIYSYINFPDRNLVTLALAWDDSAKTGAQIVQDVLDMKQSSINNKHFGPNWMLYIPTAYETKLDEDYSTAKGSNTIRERIMQISGISGIKVVDRMPSDNVLLVQMTSDVVRLVRGMGLTNIQWQTEGNMLNKYKVMTIQVPQIKSDQNGKTGIVHLA
jgi:hypothetical protein